MFRKLLIKMPIALFLLTTINLDCVSDRAMAQQSKIHDEPLQILDASTGKLIPEVLLLPRYSRFRGTSTLLGEGPGRGTNRNYLAKPFIYRTGDPFILKRPKSVGLPLAGIVFIGKGRSIDGVLIVAPGYRPLWFTSLWSVGPARELRLTPVSKDEWWLLSETTLGPLTRAATRIKDECAFWMLPSRCSLEIHYNKKERELVRSFLEKSRHN